jgi:hypothetical protein
MSKSKLNRLTSKICTILLIQHLKRCKGIILAFPFLVQVEKNELCDEEQRLKAGKENLEEQVKAMNAQTKLLTSSLCDVGYIFCSS